MWIQITFANENEACETGMPIPKPIKVTRSLFIDFSELWINLFDLKTLSVNEILNLPLALYYKAFSNLQVKGILFKCIPDSERSLSTMLGTMI